MLRIGRLRQRNCAGLTRRAFLEVGGASVLGLTLGDLLRVRAEESLLPVRARQVVLLWLWGGPAQLDTWDPKPDAPLEYRGPFAPIATAVPGIRISELFPKVARLADTFSLLRSLHTGSNDHGVAGTMGLTGSGAGAINLGGAVASGSTRPATGAVVARVRGGVAALPPFVVVGGRLHQGKKVIAGEGGGPLGAGYDPFRLEYDPAGSFRVPALELTTDLTPERLADRDQLRRTFDRLERQTQQAAGSLDAHRGRAMAMLTGPEARRAFDLADEPASLKERYGPTRFGRSCLLARRLVEHGVPFVQVNWSDHVEAEEDSGDGGWDHHYRNFQIMQDRHGPWLDQALSAFLTDLRARGLLETTLVIAVGEFGRSPKINDKAGRDHWEHCYSALLAGGGVVGGRVVGESDRRAEHPHDKPATPADLGATIQHLVGISSEQAVSLGIVTGGRVIEELL